ncbi:alpha-L-fucosidase [Thalassobacterium sedimentorum]|nr:alpha-L-fucosidase [Coraliomargarita sp. SDUM461004]
MLPELARGQDSTIATVDPLSFDYRFPSNLQQTVDSQLRNKQWFIDAKYGVFIHFGVYSKLAGAYDGRGQDFNYSEWILTSAKMSAKEYRTIASAFNPASFDAEQWVRTFHELGLQYLVVTAKHHDGFALFDSTVSDYNIVDYTPFKRDIILELSEACQRYGMRFGVYYSHAQDWNDPDAPYLTRMTQRSVLFPELDEDYKPDFERYLRTKSLPQVEELLKRYDLDLIWFDTPVDITFEWAKQFSDLVRRYQPNCLINSRIIHNGGDQILQDNLELFDYVSIRDKEIPTQKLPLYVETPDSVSSSFGYKAHGDFHYHSEEEILHRLINTVCSGGNLLLNNGPMGNGQLDPEALRLYQVIGDWLKVNGESIFHTRRNPFPNRPAWGNYTVSKDLQSLYVHILQWPEDSKITLPEGITYVSKATILGSVETVTISTDNSRTIISLPCESVHPYATVVKLSLSDELLLVSDVE